MENHNINLNIHYTAPDWVWTEIENIYNEMPYWRGTDKDGFPIWRDNNGGFIEVSVEPSGLQFYAEMPVEQWTSWIELFKKKADERLGYKIGEPEDGFEFKYEW